MNRLFSSLLLSLILILAIGDRVFAGDCASVPKFELRNLDGDLDSLEKHLGRQDKPLIILSFFQKLCQGCKEETKAVLEWQKTSLNGPKTDFIMIAVNETRQKGLEFLEDNDFSAYVLADPYGKTKKLFALTTLPRMIALNNEGKILKDYSPKELSEIRKLNQFSSELDALIARTQSDCRG